MINKRNINRRISYKENHGDGNKFKKNWGIFRSSIQ